MAEGGGGSSSRPPGAPSAREGAAEAIDAGTSGEPARDPSRDPSSEPASGPLSGPVSGPVSGPGSERRSERRLEVVWSVDCETEDTFLYAAITNISELGIFVRTEQPLPVGTQLRLRFEAPDPEAEAGRLTFSLRGVVQWVNEQGPLAESPNPGMGIRFIGLSADDRERLVEVVRTIAYLRPPVN